MYVHAHTVRSIYFHCSEDKIITASASIFLQGSLSRGRSKLGLRERVEDWRFCDIQTHNFHTTFILRRWMILNFNVVNTVSRLNWLERCHYIFFEFFEFECMFISEAFFPHRTLKRRPWRKLPQKRLPGPERLVPWCWLHPNFGSSNCQAQARRDARKEAPPTVKCCTKCWIEMSNPPLWYVYNIYYNIYIYQIYYDPKEGSRSCLGLGTKSWRSLTSFAQITRLKVMSLHHDARREELGRG